MTPSGRLAAALDLLEEIGAGKRPADVIVQNYFRQRRYAGSKDRAAIQARVYSALRRLGEIRWRIGRLGSDVLAPRAWLLAEVVLSEEDPAALFDGQRYGPKALDDFERRLAAGLAEGPGDLPAAARLNVPDWIWPMFEAAFRDQVETEAAALNEPALVDLRVNVARGSREEALALLAEDGIEATVSPISPIGLRLANRVPLTQSRAYRDGWVEPQDEGSQMLALAVDASPGQLVVDLCAGGGGKTLALAAAMAGEGRLVACDRSSRRLGGMTPRLTRAGIEKFVEARVFRDDDGVWWDELCGHADRVLVDAPCSGTGGWRRRPYARWQLTREDIKRDLSRQQLLLVKAATLVKVGGRLIYATCSVLPGENEAQVDGFLARDKGRGFKRVNVAEQLQVDGMSGPDIRLTPAKHGTDGVYAAVLERVA